MAKINEVSKLANVSVATVSRVIRNESNVSDETRRKVLKAIEKLNYQPNVMARNLRNKKTQTILVIVPNVTNAFFSEVILGIESVAWGNNYQVLLGDTQHNPDTEYNYLNSLRQKLIDGIILLTARIKRDFIEEIAEEHPVVLACQYIEGTNLPTVSIDNISAARKATEHLIKLNHRRIAHISGPLSIIVNRDRLKGFNQALEKFELEIEPSLVQEGDFTLTSGYNLTMKLLALKNRPTAIFAANDEMAIGAIKAVRNYGLRIPQDVAVVGFDNIKMASIFEPAVTTIGQPAFEIGEKAMNLLLKQIKHENIEKRQYVLDDELIIRESCGYNLRS